jgi:predicted permease
MFQQIFSIIAPVIVIAFIGYTWQRRGLPFDNNTATYLASYIGGPCLLLHSLLASKVELALLLRMAGATMLVLGSLGLLGWALVSALKLPARVYVPALMFPNTGNMGLPLCLFAFGDTGLALAIAFYAVTGLLQFSVGISIASGQISLRSLLTNPMMITILIGAALVGTKTTLPLWIDNILEVLGHLLIPLMLLSLGTSLAKLRFVGLTRTIAFSALRIAGGFAVALGVVWLLKLDGPARGVVIIQASMPVAVFTYLFALRFETKPDDVAAMVFISTILSFFMLPLILGYVLSLP